MVKRKSQKAAWLLTFLVGLSDTEVKNYDKIIKYKNNQMKIPESQCQNELDRLCEPYSKTVCELHYKQKRLSNKEIAEVVAGYKAGKTIRDLAQKFNCHRITISNKLKASGITVCNIPDENRIHELIKLYQSGLSLTTVGDQVGLSRTSVLKYLQLNGIETRDPHGRAKN